MNANKTKIGSYFDLAEHNPVQKAVFYTIILVTALIFFAYVFMPLMEFVFKVYLDGVVYNVSNEILPDREDSTRQKMTNYFTLWAIDIYKKTPQEARYWFEPVTSFFIPSFIMGTGISIAITSVIPQRLGLMRQKIEREIANFLSKIALKEYDNCSDDAPLEIIDMILSANLREMHALADKWEFNIEDLKILRKAIIWNNSNIFYRITHLNHGLTIYMRYYFTVKYANTILGFVYMGAAVLIIIIGMRGIKFIPSTQPSLIFCSLGLEFSMLITYAFTLMYERPEEDSDKPDKNSEALPTLFGAQNKSVNTKEIENLLKVFIKYSKK